MNVEREKDEKPWYYDLMQYLKHRIFFLDGEILYKKMQDHTLLRCVEEKEARLIMEEVHEGICGTHANGHRLARQIMRAGYYWLTMESDCITYTRKCHKCQIYAIRFMHHQILYMLCHPRGHSQCGAWMLLGQFLQKLQMVISASLS